MADVNQTMSNMQYDFRIPQINDMGEVIADNNTASAQQFSTELGLGRFLDAIDGKSVTGSSTNSSGGVYYLAYIIAAASAIGSDTFEPPYVPDTPKDGLIPTVFGLWDVEMRDMQGYALPVPTKTPTASPSTTGGQHGSNVPVEGNGVAIGGSLQCLTNECFANTVDWMNNYRVTLPGSSNNDPDPNNSGGYVTGSSDPGLSLPVSRNTLFFLPYLSPLILVLVALFAVFGSQCCTATLMWGSAFAVPFYFLGVIPFTLVLMSSDLCASDASLILNNTVPVFQSMCTDHYLGSYNKQSGDCTINFGKDFLSDIGLNYTEWLPDGLDVEFTYSASALMRNMFEGCHPELGEEVGCGLVLCIGICHFVDRLFLFILCVIFYDSTNMIVCNL